MQLSFADVDGIYFSGAVLQHAVREAAGGGADVEADGSGEVEVEGLHGSFELFAASADESFRFFDGDFVIERDGVARLGGRLAIDEHLSGQDEAFCFFPAFGKAFIYEKLVESCFFHLNVI